MKKKCGWPPVVFDEKWPKMIPSIFRNQLTTDTTMEYIFGVNTDAMPSTVETVRAESMVTGVTYDSGVSAEAGSAVAAQPTLEEFLRRDPAIEAVAIEVPIQPDLAPEATTVPAESSEGARFSEVREHQLDVPGASLSVPGALWGQSGRSWGQLGRSWDQLGRTWGQLGRTWGELGRIWGELEGIWG